MTDAPVVTEPGRARSGSPAERFTSRDWADFPQPHGKDELWQFTPLARMRPLLSPSAATGRIALHADQKNPVRWSSIAARHPATGRVLQPADRVSALAWSQAGRAWILDIPGRHTPEQPISVVLRGEPGISYHHLVVNAAADSRAVVILDHQGSTTSSGNVEVSLGRGAHLTLVALHDWDEDAVHVSAHACSVGPGATLEHVSVNIGGGVLRTSPSVHFLGPGGTAHMLGVGVAGAGQHLETRLHIDHAYPDCVSDVLYKNVLAASDARTVWTGDVRIRPQARQTSTYEMNRNLILRPGARADSVPNLEIETGDVQEAGHASATGRFDDEQLFYLQSRGIPQDQAQQLVVRGFLADVVHRIDAPSVRDRIMAAIDAKLSSSPSRKAT
ncbi:Fe-S cluster assembly protein SufD [Streptomyces sp. AK02-01A]|uniref:Fe-S cluster assembly protein SufD n=1 Tax=Streptomyces sp. AK02-01A TaxID=3028648 RepID=UPI0029B18454|nr:Fe-S cluster assembly protein SufD [Streptomyces sp. AK02-01A]MDX3853133.1 Fe-S cluster assembly protein SufD [Streptomyces sp. AK02-01A]